MRDTLGNVIPPWNRTLVVVAHPDDESFGLGAVIDRFVAGGSVVHVLCLTQGEASTLGSVEGLAAVRAREFTTAAQMLGVQGTTLKTHPDGGLADMDRAALVADVAAAIAAHEPDGLLVFDPSGITGHPDHTAATLAALDAAAARELPVLAWTLPETVAQRLKDEFGMPFTGHPEQEVDLRLTVFRTRQRAACKAHASQTPPGAPLWRRLQLLNDCEALRWLRR